MTDKISAAQTYEFLRKWLMDHQEFMSNVLYVGGDSYSGIIIPIIVQEIHNGNSAGRAPLMKLTGYLIGNPVTHLARDVNARVEYARGMALISHEIYEAVKRSCQGDYVNVDPENVECLKDLENVTKCLEKLYNANILEPNCPPYISPKSSGIRWNEALLEQNPMDILLSWSEPPALWCRTYTYALSYLWCNDENVQNALHIRKGTIKTWVRCNEVIPYTSDVVSTVDYHRNFTKTGYRSLIYSGDHDLFVPYVGTLKWIRTLDMTINDVWGPWLVDGQVAGYTISFTKNQYHMTYATVKGGGHTAPEYKPKQCFAMAKRWFAHYPL